MTWSCIFNDELTPSPKLFGPILIVRRACYSNHRRNLWLAETIPNSQIQQTNTASFIKKKEGRRKEKFPRQKSLCWRGHFTRSKKKNFKQKTIQLESRTAGHPLCIFKRFKKRPPLVSGPGACHLLVFFFCYSSSSYSTYPHRHTPEMRPCVHCTV